MNSIESELYQAFNATSELRAKSVLAITGTRHERLTPQELIVHGSMIRGHLEQALSDTDYRVLLLYFKEISDLDVMMTYMEPVKALVKSTSNLFGDVDPVFFDVVCASEFRGMDLFRTSQYGTMRQYLKAGQTSDLLTRRKKRIIKSLKKLRQQALGRACELLTPMNSEDGYINIVV